MLPIRLEIKNFLPYIAPDAVRFDGIHLACLTGANGAGKSSLLDAITWALWGKARAKRDEDLVHMGQQDMYVQLDFEQEGQIYRVIRRRTRRQRSGGTLDLLIQDEDEQFTLISEPNMKATQTRINHLLRLDYDTFTNSAFLQQGKADAFTTKTPRERKQILSDILGLAQWERYEETVKQHLKSIEAELQVIELRIHEIDEELAKEPGLQVALVEAERAQAEAKQALEAAEVHLKEVEHAPLEMRGVQQSLADTEKRCKEHQKDVEVAEREVDHQQQRIDAFEAVIAQRQAIESGYAVLKAAREADHDLGDKLLQLSDFDQEQNTLEKALREARATLENEASGYRARIAELERTSNQAVSGDIEAVQVEVLELQALEIERDNLQTLNSQLGEERAELDATNRALRTEMLNIKDRLDRLENAADATCPLCGQPLDEGHRTELVDQLAADGTLRGDTFRGNEKRLKTIVDDVKEHKQHLSEIDINLKRLPPLLERAGLLQAQINAARQASNRLDEEQVSLQAVENMLESEAFALEIRNQLNTLLLRRSEVGYNRDSHDTARKQLATYSDFERQQNELNLALQSLPEAQSAFEGARLRVERNQKAVLDDQKQMQLLQSEITRLQVLVDEYHVRQQEVDRLRLSERNAYQRLVNARQELDALEKQRLRKLELQKRSDQKRHEESMYKELRVAFGKNGIPAMIIETAIPELEYASNQLLSRMSGGRMHLRFNTQREKITGGIAETLDIEIADELGTRSYEMYSGGEAFRIDFAIRVALSQMLARRAGAHLRTLFIDEGFGTQDADGRDRLVEAITAIQNDFDMILVITHIDELRDSFPVHIVIDKTPNGSRISVR